MPPSQGAYTIFCNECRTKRVFDRVNRAGVAFLLDQRISKQGKKYPFYRYSIFVLALGELISIRDK